MNLYLDTCILETKNLTADGTLDAVARYCVAYGGAVYLCRTVVVELTQHRVQDVRELHRVVRRLGRPYAWLTGRRLENELVPGFDAEARVLQVLAARPEMRIVEHGPQDTEHAVRAMYTGRKPAKPAGQRNKSEVDPAGFKDVLVWRAFVTLVAQRPEEAFVFVSNNPADFRDGQRKPQDPVRLHEDLLAELGEDGAARTTYRLHLEDFLREHAGPVSSFEVTGALDALVAAPDLTNAAFTDAGLPEAVLTEVLAVSHKAVGGYGRFSCELDVVATSGESGVGGANPDGERHLVRVRTEFSVQVGEYICESVEFLTVSILPE